MKTALLIFPVSLCVGQKWPESLSRTWVKSGDTWDYGSQEPLASNMFYGVADNQAKITTAAKNSVLLGGENNALGDFSDAGAATWESAVIGGMNNENGANRAIVIGGNANHIAPLSHMSVIVGGSHNTVTGKKSYALGQNARALADNSMALGFRTAPYDYPVPDGILLDSYTPSESDLYVRAKDLETLLCWKAPTNADVSNCKLCVTDFDLTKQTANEGDAFCKSLLKSDGTEAINKPSKAVIGRNKTTVVSGVKTYYREILTAHLSSNIPTSAVASGSVQDASWCIRRGEKNKKEGRVFGKTLYTNQKTISKLVWTDFGTAHIRCDAPCTATEPNSVVMCANSIDITGTLTIKGKTIEETLNIPADYETQVASLEKQILVLEQENAQISEQLCDLCANTVELTSYFNKAAIAMWNSLQVIRDTIDSKFLDMNVPQSVLDTAKETHKVTDADLLKLYPKIEAPNCAALGNLCDYN